MPRTLAPSGPSRAASRLSRTLVASTLLVATTTGLAVAQETPPVPACARRGGEEPGGPPSPPSPRPPRSGTTPGTRELEAGELTVFAAASLRDVLESVAADLRASQDIEVVYAFDSSSALRAQIELGAPADVFASADVANVEALVRSGLAVDPVAFACNELAIVVPVGNPAAIATPVDLGRDGVDVVAAGDDVPITAYASRLVEGLGIADAYHANVVSREDNVAAVRAKVELGEGDAAVVYRTDAIESGERSDTVEIPAGANVPVTHAAAVIADTDQPRAARAFLEALRAPGAQAALAAHGFLPAPEPGA